MSSSAFNGALDAVSAMPETGDEPTDEQRRMTPAELATNRARLNALSGGDVVIIDGAGSKGPHNPAVKNVLAWMLADTESRSDTPPANAVGDGLPKPSLQMQAAMAELDAMGPAMLADTAEQAQRTCTELLELSEGLAERHGTTGMPLVANGTPAEHHVH